MQNIYNVMWSTCLESDYAVVMMLHSYPSRAVNVELQEGTDNSFSSIIVIENSHFESNRGLGPGGALHLYQEDGLTSLNIKNSIFNNNMVSDCIPLYGCMDYAL